MDQKKALTHLYFYDVPVYRTKPGIYQRQLNQLREKSVNPEIKFSEYDFRTIWQPMSEKSKEDFIKMWAHSFETSQRNVPWRYNEIIGYIRLYTTLGMVKGEYYLVDAKRLRRDRKRTVIRYYDKVLEVHVRHWDSREQIAEKLLGSLRSLQTESLFKERFIDLELFSNLINFVNWKELIPTGEF